MTLMQFRPLSFHTGMLNGQTIIETNEFPMWVSETSKYVDDGIFCRKISQRESNGLFIN